MNSLDWAHSINIMRMTLSSSGLASVSQMENKRFVYDFVPATHPDVQLKLLQGYGDGMDKIRQKRHMLPTNDIVYLIKARETVADETQNIASTDDTETGYRLGCQYAYWQYHKHGQALTKRYQSDDERAEMLNDVLFDKMQNVFHLTAMMHQAQQENVQTRYIKAQPYTAAPRS